MIDRRIDLLNINFLAIWHIACIASIAKARAKGNEASSVNISYQGFEGSSPPQADGVLKIIIDKEKNHLLKKKLNENSIMRISNFKQLPDPGSTIKTKGGERQVACRPQRSFYFLI